MVSKDLRIFLMIASFMMVLNISIGAFGAHGLKQYLDEYSTIIYTKAVSYSFYNTLGLFAISFMVYILPNSSKLKKAFYFVLSGTLIFSFSLYILALSKIMWLGAITPIGGSLMIIGWLLLAYAIKKDMNK